MRQTPGRNFELLWFAGGSIKVLCVIDVLEQITDSVYTQESLVFSKDGGAQ